MIKEKIVKIESKKQNKLKICYGTSEWSENSGICCNCKLQDNCGKMNLKRLKN